ncbi:MAG: MFS transporter [Pseudomonadota bacterium]
MTPPDGAVRAEEADAAGADRARLGIIGSLSVAHELPATMLGVFVPTLFIKELGVPVSYLGLFGIPLLVTALKWLWAPLVDSRGWIRFGKRRSWILPASFCVSALYLIIAGVTPSFETLPLVIGLFVLVQIAFSTYEIAADAYVVESLTRKQRGLGSSVVWFGKELGQIIGLAGLLYVADVYGWTAAFLTAAALFSLLNMTVLLRAETLGDAENEQPRRIGRRADVRHYFREPVNRRVLLLVLCFAFAIQMPIAVIGPFLGSKGLTLSEVGVAIGVAASIGAGLSLALSSVIVSRLGAKRTALVLIPAGLMALPAFLWLASADAPGLTTVMLVVFWGSICTAPMRMVFYAARLGWTSKTQVGTDFTIQQSVWFVGYGATLAVSGLLAALIGWTWFFVVSAVLTTLMMLSFIHLHDRIEADIAAWRDRSAPDNADMITSH